MGLDLDYRSADFRGLNPEGRIARCREMANEAARLAANAKRRKARRVFRSGDSMECAG